MRYPYFSNHGTLANGRWHDLFGNQVGTTSAGFGLSISPVDGSIEDVHIRIGTAPGGAAVWTFALQINESTVASTTIAGSATTASMIGAWSVDAGQRVRMAVTASGGPASSSQCWVTFELAADTPNEYGMSAMIGSFSAGTRYHNPFFPGHSNSTNTSATVMVAAPCAMTAILLGTHFSSITSSQTLTAVVQVSTDNGANFIAQDGTGGTVNTTTVLTNVPQHAVVAGTFSLSLARGDLFRLSLTANELLSEWITLATRFVATTPGEANLSYAGNQGSAATSTSINYTGLLRSSAPAFADWSATDHVTGRSYVGTHSVGLKSPVCWTNVAPGASATRTISLLRNGSDTPVSVTLTGGTAPIVAGGSGAQTCHQGSYFTVKHTPSGSPTVSGQLRWTFVVQVLEATGLRITQSVVEVIGTFATPTGGGEVPDGINPPASVVPGVGPIRLFAEFKLGSGSSFAVAETAFYRDPPTWYSGPKKARILSVSGIERELSADGSFRGSQVRLVLADDGTFRTLATTTTISNGYVGIYLVSDDVRYAQGEPFRIFGGRIHDYRALPGFQFEVVIRDVLSQRMADLDISPRIPPDRLSLEQFPGMDQQYEGRAAPLVIGLANDSLELGNFSTPPQGVVPPVILGRLNFTAFGGINQNVIAAIWSTGAIAANGVWQVYYNPPNQPDRRVLVPLSEFGTTIWTPGMPGWVETGAATNYIDYPPASAETRRYTPLFINASHPYATAVEEGRILIAGNLFGITDNADGSGFYIDDAPRVWQWLIVNQLFHPYRSGAYAAIPMLDDTYTILDTASVTAVVQYLRTRLEFPSYPVGFIVGREGQQQTFRHIAQELCAGVLMEQGINRHGQLMVSVEDPDAEATLALSDLLDIETDSFEVWVDRAAYFNRVDFSYGRRYVPPSAPAATPATGDPLPARTLKPYHEWTSGLKTLDHVEAIAANQGDVRAVPFENWVVRDDSVAHDVALRMVTRAVGPAPAYDGPRMFRLTTSWQGLQAELGTVLAITHVEGLGPSGYEGQRARVLKIAIDPQRARVTLEGRILYALGGGGIDDFAPEITSGSVATFTEGGAGSFTVTTTGSPVAVISRTGSALPAGVTFVDHGNGTATLAGTPESGTAGAYVYSITAANPAGSDVEPLTLTVLEEVLSVLPEITSAGTVTFTAGEAASFTVTTSGIPAPTLARTGAALPAGVTFTDNGNGTATLAGTPGGGTAGSYAFTITATNSAGADVETLTLTVDEEPSSAVVPEITSGGTVTFEEGTFGSFTVTTTGSPTPSIARTGASLPSGITFTDNGNGTATLSGTPAGGTADTYSFTITATNSAGSDGESLTLTVDEDAPAVGTRLPRTVTFDAGSVSTGWDGFNNASGCTLTSTGAFSGQALRCPLVSGTNSDNYADFYFGDHMLVDGDKVTEVWVRLWVKYASGITWPSSTQKIALLNLTDAAGDRQYQMMLDVDPDGEFFVERSIISTWSFFGHYQNMNGSPVGPNFNNWDKLKLYVQLNTPGSSNGIVRLWINDTLKLEYTNLNIRQSTSLGMNKFILSSYATPNNPSNGTVWYDQVTISADDPDLDEAVAPEITSVGTATFTEGAAGSFTVTTTGIPTPTISRSGDALPSGLSFVDNGNGTATLSGTPGGGTDGEYEFTITATNSEGSDHEDLTLTINEALIAPEITSGGATSFDEGEADSFTITTTGSPTPSLSRSGTLPTGLSFTDNGNGTATIAGTAGAGTAGTYNLTITATNAAGSDNEGLTITVTEDVGGPTDNVFTADFTSPGTLFGFNDSAFPENSNPGSTALHGITRTNVAGGGPSGDYALEWTHAPRTLAQLSGSPWQNQHYGGRVGRSGISGFNYGESMYIRMYLRAMVIQNPKGWTFTNELYADSITSKFIDIGLGDNNCRVILQLDFGNMAWVGGPTNGWSARLTKGINDGPRIFGTVANGWVALQWRVQANTSYGAANGAIYGWRNNDTFGSPTTSQTGLATGPRFSNGSNAWSEANAHQFWNQTLANDGGPTASLVIRGGGYVIGRSFDPNWHANMT